VVAETNTRQTTNGQPAGPVRVLVVGDPEALRGIVVALHEHSCVVDSTDDPKMVSDRCDEHWPDVVVLDVTKSNRDAALDSLDWLRRSANVAVVAMTERGDVDARLRALTLRAEDTVAPTDPREIVGRVAVLVRRSRFRRTEMQPLGDLLIDRNGRRVSRRGNAVVLTHRELQVLEILVERPGRVVSKEELLARVWDGKQRSLNAVEAQISALRRKLHEIGPPVIHTSHGEGYVFRPAVATETGQRSHLIAERERIVREREEAVARRTKLLRQMEEQFARRSALHRGG
jgi:DNA-binding response OmpR family regulator